jgi:hypothetical protein
MNNDQQRRDDAPRYHQSASDKARHDEREEHDDLRWRHDRALGQQPLTAREREERWPIG